MSSANPRSVLVFFSAGGEFSLQMFSGVCAYARKVGWQVLSAEYQAVDRKFVRMARSPMDAIPGLLDFWKPDGCIVDFGNASSDWIDKPFANIPTVYFERYNPNSGWPFCVYGDSESVVKIVARELFRFDFDHYAIVPWKDETIWWSRERVAVFSDLVTRQSKVIHVYHHEKGNETDTLSNRLDRWIGNLPKPCGVFAVNDVMGEAVLGSCKRQGVSVPGDVIVVGVDDESKICETTSPTLSSVSRDFVQSGVVAARLLDERMTHPRKRHSSKTFAAAGLVRRESSRLLSGATPAVNRALEYIRLHANEGIGPRDVVAIMGVSRTPADIAFRKGVGHTILDEIHEVRLENAKKLLSAGNSPEVVSDMCGYASLMDFRRVFRKRLGMTVGQFLRNSWIV